MAVSVSNYISAIFCFCIGAIMVYVANDFLSWLITTMEAGLLRIVLIFAYAIMTLMFVIFIPLIVATSEDEMDLRKIT